MRLTKFIDIVVMSRDFPIVQVKNLPYSTSTAALYDLFGRYGSINQIRVPKTTGENAGTAIVIYNNMINAERALKELSGVNYNGRYLVSSLFVVDKSKFIAEDYIHRAENLEKIKKEYGVI